MTADVEAVDAAETPAMVGPDKYALLLLLTLTLRERLGKAHIYSGTVPPHVKARRRAAGKVARSSRRINRRRSA